MRGKSAQADEFEILENNIATDLIDIKNSNQKIDVYDLQAPKPFFSLFGGGDKVDAECNT